VNRFAHTTPLKSLPAVRRALISDIHGNLEALRAVLDDIRQQNCDQVLCLGDVVGYGPNPCECVDVVMELDACVLGNHDLGALFDPEGFSNTAEQAIFWTRKQLEQDPDAQAARKRLDFLSRLPRNRREGRLMFVHGSVRNPMNEYVFPEDIYNRRKMEKLFSMIQGFCFQGHTHVPGVFTNDMQFITPEQCQFRYTLSLEKAMINVGSVGQPRDGDWRSCYLIVDVPETTVSASETSLLEPKLEFRRVEYDVERTIEKIYSIADLDNFLGDRLREGR
jgi:predicted phosphodiesterase